MFKTLMFVVMMLVSGLTFANFDCQMAAKGVAVEPVGKIASVAINQQPQDVVTSAGLFSPTGIFNYVKNKFGALPKGVHMFRRALNSTDRKIWQAYRRNRSENFAVEIYDKDEKMIVVSEIVTSHSSEYIDARLARETFSSTLKQAHEIASDSSSWRIRFIHNHPGGFTHSTGDRQFFLRYKSVLEAMGYHDATVSMDVMYRSNGVVGYSLTPEHTLKNGSYWSPSIDLDKLSGLRDSFSQNAKIRKEAFEEKFGIKTLTDKMPKSFENVSNFALSEGRTVALMYSSKSIPEDAPLGVLDSELNTIGGLVAFLARDDIEDQLKKVNAKGQEVRLFLAPSSHFEIENMIQIGLDLRAILDKFNYKMDFVFLYQGRNKSLKEFRMESDFKVDGSLVVSEAVERLLWPDRFE